MDLSRGNGLTIGHHVLHSCLLSDVYPRSGLMFPCVHALCCAQNIPNYTRIRINSKLRDVPKSEKNDDGRKIPEAHFNAGVALEVVALKEDADAVVQKLVLMRGLTEG